MLSLFNLLFLCIPMKLQSHILLLYIVRLLTMLSLSNLQSPWTPIKLQSLILLLHIAKQLMMLIFFILQSVWTLVKLQSHILRLTALSKYVYFYSFFSNSLTWYIFQSFFKQVGSYELLPFFHFIVDPTKYSRFNSQALQLLEKWYFF